MNLRIQDISLMAHNWTKKKRVFLSCYCYEIYQVQAVGLRNWVNFLKNCYFANNCLLKVWIWELFCTHFTHIAVIIFLTTNFVSTKSIFHYIQISLPNFGSFSSKSPSVTQRSVSQENAFKKSKHHHLSFAKLKTQIILLL